eukprot:1652818-Pyramimonas_sp.AAC.1
MMVLLRLCFTGRVVPVPTTARRSYTTPWKPACSTFVNDQGRLTERIWNSRRIVWPYKSRGCTVATSISPRG